MIWEPSGKMPLQQTSVMAGQFLDLLAIAILMLYVYYYAEYRREDNSTLKRKARQRSTITLLGFALFSILVAMVGPSNTFVAPIGVRVESYFASLAQSIFQPGVTETATGQTDLLTQVTGWLKLIGLITYVLFFGAISASNAVIAKLTRFISNIGHD